MQCYRCFLQHSVLKLSIAMAKEVVQVVRSVGSNTLTGHIEELSGGLSFSIRLQPIARETAAFPRKKKNMRNADFSRKIRVTHECASSVTIGG